MIKLTLLALNNGKNKSTLKRNEIVFLIPNKLDLRN